MHIGEVCIRKLQRYCEAVLLSLLALVTLGDAIQRWGGPSSKWTFVEADLLWSRPWSYYYYYRLLLLLLFLFTVDQCPLRRRSALTKVRFDQGPLWPRSTFTKVRFDQGLLRPRSALTKVHFDQGPLRPRSASTKVRFDKCPPHPLAFVR